MIDTDKRAAPPADAQRLAQEISGYFILSAGFTLDDVARAIAAWNTRAAMSPAETPGTKHHLNGLENQDKKALLGDLSNTPIAMPPAPPDAAPQNEYERGYFDGEAKWAEKLAALPDDVALLEGTTPKSWKSENRGSYYEIIDAAGRYLGYATNRSHELFAAAPDLARDNARLKSQLDTMIRAAVRKNAEIERLRAVNAGLVEALGRIAKDHLPVSHIYKAGCDACDRRAIAKRAIAAAKGGAA